MNGEDSTIDVAKLLTSVADQLKVPLTNIARQAELLSLQGMHSEQFVMMRTQSTAAIALVDSYLLGLELLNNAQLDLEPVSASSVLTEVAHQIQGYAKQHGIIIELSIAGRYEPIMAHLKALRAAVASLGYALIEAGSSGATGTSHITLAVHKTRKGITVGLYGNKTLANDRWLRAKDLHGRARQPLASTLGTSGAGLFVADALAVAMNTKLIVTRYAQEQGMAMTFAPSQQMQFL